MSARLDLAATAAEQANILRQRGTMSARLFEEVYAPRLAELRALASGVGLDIALQSNEPAEGGAR